MKLYCDFCGKQKPDKQLMRTFTIDGVRIICKSCDEKYEKEHPKTQEELKRDYELEKLKKLVELQETGAPFWVQCMVMSDDFNPFFRCGLCFKEKPIQQMKGWTITDFTLDLIHYCNDCEQYADKDAKSLVKKIREIDKKQKE